jgi:pyrimidine oxygenase
MEDCRNSADTPQADIKLICAGSSDQGMAFSMRYADYNFCLGVGVNTSKGFAQPAARLQTEAAKSGRAVGTFVLLMIIADETDSAAFANWDHYRAGVDTAAIAWLGIQAAADTRPGTDIHIRQAANAASAVNFNKGTLVGSYESVAHMLDEVATVPATARVLLTLSMTSSRGLKTSALASSH